ncbi:MAG: hypothetical protein HY749_19825 [Gammaproteobacteria bacterium]|nr:hypothetical protein [Gammaproteobacteria bacterium]
MAAGEHGLPLTAVTLDRAAPARAVSRYAIVLESAHYAAGRERFLAAAER